MYCKHCGKNIPGNAKFCPSCGAAMDGFDTSFSGSDDFGSGSNYGASYGPRSSVGFGEAIQLFFKRYTDFNTRSRRSEYWWAMLFCSLVSLALSAILGTLAYLWSLAILLPTLAVNVRRLHDIGKSGWWYLIILVPLAGSIVLLVLCCQDSVPGRNQWGPNPKY